MRPLIPITIILVIGAIYLMTRKNWTPPEAAQPYLYDIYKAEDDNGIPRNLLARLLYQESRYRQDIISGETVSHAGAIGIAQIVPRWHPNVDPLNPYASIHYAAGYLAKNYRRFKNWPEALAAYNWGPTAVARKGLGRAPKETRDYYSQILSDVAVA